MSFIPLLLSRLSFFATGSQRDNELHEQRVTRGTKCWPAYYQDFGCNCCCLQRNLSATLLLFAVAMAKTSSTFLTSLCTMQQGGMRFLNRVQCGFTFISEGKMLVLPSLKSLLHKSQQSKGYDDNAALQWESVTSGKATMGYCPD